MTVTVADLIDLIVRAQAPSFRAGLARSFLLVLLFLPPLVRDQHRPRFAVLPHDGVFPLVMGLVDASSELVSESGKRSACTQVGSACETTAV